MSLWWGSPHSAIFIHKLGLHVSIAPKIFWKGPLFGQYTSYQVPIRLNSSSVGAPGQIGFFFFFPLFWATKFWTQLSSKWMASYPFYLSSFVINFWHLNSTSGVEITIAHLLGLTSHMDDPDRRRASKWSKSFRGGKTSQLSLVSDMSGLSLQKRSERSWKMSNPFLSALKRPDPERERERGGRKHGCQRISPPLQLPFPK